MSSEARPHTEAAKPAGKHRQAKPNDWASLLDKPVGVGGGGDLFAQILNDPAAFRAIQDRLPANMRDDARRLLLIAKGYIGRNASAMAKVAACTRASLMDAICTAAEMGFALDGKHCYAVPYGNVLQCQVSYIGMVVAAKRLGIVQDAWSVVVMRSDSLDITDRDGVRHYLFSRDLDTTRDYAKCRGVLTVIVHKGGVSPEWMTRDEIEKRHAMSKGASRDDSPWKQWPEEMACAKGFRAAMKLHGDDPSMALVMQSADTDEEFAAMMSRPVGGRTLDDVRQQLAEPRQRTREDDSPHVPVDRGSLFDDAGLPTGAN